MLNICTVFRSPDYRFCFVWEALKIADHHEEKTDQKYHDYHPKTSLVHGRKIKFEVWTHNTNKVKRK